MLSTRKRRPSSSYGYSSKRVKTSREVVPRPFWRPTAFRSAEWKFLDTAVNTAVNSTPVIILINGMVHGNTAITRIGEKIAVESVQMRLAYEVNTGTGLGQIHAYDLVLDRQANATGITALTDYLTAATIHGIRNLNARRRFKILWRWRKWLSINSTDNEGGVIEYYAKFRRPIIVEFNGANNGDINDIVTNALFFTLVGDVAAGANAGQCVGNIRIPYTDI